MDLLDRKRIGMVLRTFAGNEEDVPVRFKMTRETVGAAKAMQIGQKPVFSRIDVIVWADARYGKRTDFSAALPEEERRERGTAAALRRELQDEKVVRVHEVSRGDLYCGVLNYAVAKQLRNRVDYTLILSPDARSYLTPEAMALMLEALERGARATGVAINELTQSVLEGRLANTLCLWDAVALMSVGGFDLRAEMPVDDRLAHYMRGWSQVKGEVYYALAGVEEVIPLARLVQVYGPCIAPILPTSEGQGYQVPDPATQPELWTRHVSKMGTKFERQSALLAAIGADMSFLRGGVMSQYRKF